LQKILRKYQFQKKTTELLHYKSVKAGSTQAGQEKTQVDKLTPEETTKAYLAHSHNTQKLVSRELDVGG
jgi:hypothetical protein